MLLAAGVEEYGRYKSFRCEHSVGHRFCLAGRTQSALVAFSYADNLELMIGTFVEMRKYRNFTTTSAVSAVIGWGEDEKTVQYEGVAIELVGAERAARVKEHLKRLPEAEIYSTMENERYFKIEPKWIRYTDLQAVPELIFEIEFLGCKKNLVSGILS